MRVSVDRSRCCGAGLCAQDLPDVFDQGDDAVVVLLDEHPADELADDLDDVAFACPSGAIRVHRD
ncbi:ferredoxin [Actinophytocola sp. S1-96]|uniref:Ferredoxin n=1 Tax=Actinophytocola gossypii TaxID=2812003 RepID=A0ABT2JE55_9PSEU|nr:ferredoxin [Actinophytocola gossypii]